MRKIEILSTGCKMKSKKAGYSFRRERWQKIFLIEIMFY